MHLKWPLKVEPSCWPNVGLSELSMSSASVLSPVRSWTRSIQRPESSDWGLRFSSVASRSVSNLAISLVERARMVLVISRVSSGAWAGWWCRYRAVSRHDGVGRDGMRAGQMGYLFPPCGWILRKRPRPAWVFRELNLRVRFPPPPPKNSHNSLCTRSSSLCRRGSAAAVPLGLPPRCAAFPRPSGRSSA